MKQPLTTQTVQLLSRLPLSERKMYAQELLGKYETQRLRLDKTAQSMAEHWAEGQLHYFERCVDELRAIITEAPTFHQYRIGRAAV